MLKERIKKMSTDFVFSSNPPFPKIIMIEPTNQCNLKCIFCKRCVSKIKPSFMKVEMARRILEESFDCGTREVGFYLTGESFVHQELHKMVKAAYEIGYSYIYITTNGVLAKKDKVQLLSDNGLTSIKFSINAGNRVQYSKIHGYDVFDDVLNNLKGALEVRDYGGGSLQYVTVSSVYMKDSKASILDLQKHYMSNTYKGRRLDDYILVKAYGFTDNDEIKQNKICHMIFNRLHVKANGYLSMCCIDFEDNLIVADLNKENIADAWNNENAVRFRKKFMENKLENSLCGNCLYFYKDEVYSLKFD